MSTAAGPIRRHHASENVPVAPLSPAPREPEYELVDLDRYVVLNDGPVGYIDVVPPLFVCYCGHPYPKAVEIAQLYEFQDAVQRVRRQSGHAHPAD